MRKRNHESIAKAICEGYRLTEEGYGSYLEREEHYRSRGLMVVSWYVESDKEGERKYNLYTRERKTRRKSSDEMIPMPGSERLVELKEQYDKPDYSTMTVKELRVVCKDKGIKGYSRLSKTELIENLNCAV